ncbi:MAG: HEAT repeat domain-containing protein [Chloroflexi bacterium]|nr:HEAT repeat domain-containing protein [Chloroflexota bacterium]
MDKQIWTWREMLGHVLDTVRPSEFGHEMEGITPETAEDDLPGIAGLTNILTSSTAMAATFDLPPDEAKAALKEIGEALAHLPEPDGLEALTVDQRKVYDLYAPFLRFMLANLGPALAGIFTHYIDGDYDLEDDPDGLTAQARDLAATDPEAAVALLDRVGAMGLRGVEWWWRWPDELDRPLADRAMAIQTILEDTHVLEPLEVEREIWRRIFRDLASTEASALEVREEETAEEADQADPLAPLFDRLYDGEEALTDELRAAFAEQGEIVIPELIDLLEDRELWPDDSDGEGYVSIHAARLLGRLQAAEAVEPLLKVIAESEPEDILRDAAIAALEEIGSPAVPATLRFLRYSRDPDLKGLLAWPLATAGKGSEKVYEALATLYNETTWDDVRSEVATVLGDFGDKRAVPLLRSALDEPDVVGWNRNAVIRALQDLGEEIDEELEDADIDEDGPFLLGTLTDESTFREFIGALPREWRNDAETIAHTFTNYVEKSITFALVETFRRTQPEIAGSLNLFLQSDIENASLDADTGGWPEWERAAYEHLQTCAWPELHERVTGLYAFFSELALADFDADADPNDLIQQAKDIVGDDAGQTLSLVGQAGALAIGGGLVWHRWPSEAEPPLSHWIAALVDLVAFLQDIGQWPLKMGEFVGSPEEERTVMPIDEALAARVRLTPEDEAFIADLRKIASPDLPPEMIRRAQSLGPGIVPALFRIINDDDLWNPAARPGRGWPPIHAITLLGHLRPPQAVPLLIDLAIEFDENAEARYRAIEALGQIGAPAAEMLWLEMRFGSDTEAQVALAPALAVAGRGDSRTAPLLLDLFNRVGWREGRSHVASSLGLLEDRSAAPPLRAALDDRRARLDDVEAMIEALEKLGVPVNTDPAVQAARRRVGLVMRRPVAATEWSKTPRNAPCPCGSGKKYKYCHGSGELTVH